LPWPELALHGTIARMNPMFKLFVKGHVWLYRFSNGKRGAKMGRLPVLLLTTRGRKSGAQRTVPVVPFHEAGETYVIASMGGQPQHPAWFFNLKANPDVEVQLGQDRWRARAEELPTERRNDIWQRIVAAMPNFGEYQKKTSRMIPVVRLVKQA
jgi:deazaflavin-dependent oxidoreductase (nitroreductase family)